MKWPSRVNYLPYKKIKNKYNDNVQNSKKSYFEENTSEGSVSIKSFWNTVKSFIRNKGILSNDNVYIKAPNYTTLNVKWGNLVYIKPKAEICDEKILLEMFNNHYMVQSELYEK